MTTLSSQAPLEISEAHPLERPLVEKGGRIAWIDVCKGIGITLVVVGHLEDQTRAQQLIYIFHMPLFFFLSGYCHKVTDRYKAFFQTKTIHLLVPYVCFLVLFAPLEWHGLHKVGAHHAGRVTLEHLAWGGDRLKGGLAVFWFMTCLFATQIVMNWLLARYSSRVVATIAVISLALSYVNSGYFPEISLPFDLNVVLAAVPIYYLGYVAKGWNLDSWGLRAVCLGGVALGVLLVLKHVPVEYDMRDAGYGIPVLTLALALANIVMVITISKWVAKIPPMASFLGRLGTASMGIMFLHLVVAHRLGAWFHLDNREALLSVAGLLISFGITMALFQWSLTRAFLLGSKKDFMGLVSSGS